LFELQGPIQTNDQITEQPNSSLLDKEINPLFDGIQASLKHQDQVSEPSPLQTLPVVKTEKIFEKRLPTGGEFALFAPVIN
jgi:hypothetical protein